MLLSNEDLVRILNDSCLEKCSSLKLEKHSQQPIVTLDTIDMVLNSYIAYCSRGLCFFSLNELNDAVERNKNAVLELLSFFLKKFCNLSECRNTDNSNSNNSLQKCNEKFSFSTEQCPELNLLRDCVNATLRTNFFCYSWSDHGETSNQGVKKYLSFKFG